MKSVDVSESVKVSVAVSPALRDVRSELIAMVGLMVSTVQVMELSTSKPSMLVLPAESEKAPDAIETTPLVVLSLLGVKVAE